MPTLTPYIAVSNAAEAIAFYKAAFGAEESFRLVEKGSGKLGHAQLLIGGALLMLADEFPDYGALSPGSIGGSPVRLHLAVPDVDEALARVVAAGGVWIARRATSFMASAPPMSPIRSAIPGC